MNGHPEEGGRAERWRASMADDMNHAEWERRQEEHWERLHRQLYWLPGYFIAWSLALFVGGFVLALVFGISLAGLAK